jgi:hypothetical protein
MVRTCSNVDAVDPEHNRSSGLRIVQIETRILDG